MQNSTLGNSTTVRSISPNEVYENKGLIIKIYRRYGLDSRNCDDFIQEVAIKCWKNKKIRFDPTKGTLLAYLARIVSNMAVDILRKKKETDFIPTDSAELEVMIEKETSCRDNSSVQEEIGELLEYVIRQLYQKYPSKLANDAFVMFSREGMNTKEVAKQLGVKEGFVNVSVHRGTERLKDIVRTLDREDFEMVKAS